MDTSHSDLAKAAHRGCRKTLSGVARRGEFVWGGWRVLMGVAVVSGGGCVVGAVVSAWGHVPVRRVLLRPPGP